MKLITVLLALAAVGSAAAAAAAAAPPPATATAESDASGWVDPNLPTQGFQAAMLGELLKGNPLGLKPAEAQAEGMDVPNAGVTFSSQHNAEVSLDAANLWSWEWDGYNVEEAGPTTVHNLKDPKWPVVLTLFNTTSSPDFAPIVNGETDKTALDALAQGLKDGSGASLGYKDIFEAVKDSALGVVTRMAKEPAQAIGGVLGNDGSDSPLTGGIDMPVDEETYIPLTDEELAQLGIPPSSPEAAEVVTEAPPAAQAVGAPPSAASRACVLSGGLLAVAALCVAGLLA